MSSSEPNLEEESASLDGYFSDAPLKPRPSYPPLRDTFETAVIITNLPKVRHGFNVLLTCAANLKYLCALCITNC